MYRFSIDSGDWIIKFSPHLQVEEKERENIIGSLMQIGSDIISFSHGDSFALFDDRYGLVVFRIEKIPSLIVTVSTIVGKEKWYTRQNKSVKKYRKKL